MLLDLVALEPDARNGAAVAARAESLGYAALWSAETKHDPFLPLVAAAAATSRLGLGTAIATSFTRSPMVTAMLAWDLQAASDGRFTLGLGTQVKGHNERRFSVPFDRPLARQRELVLALRHVWGAFQGEHPLRFRGEFYRLDLMTPFFDPGPIEHPRVPIFLAAVTPRAYRIAGEVADGVHVHPFHTPRYLREVALPALEEGLAASGRTRADVTLAAPVFALVAGGAEEEARQQIAFYGSTRTYRAVLETHGRGELSGELHRLLARGELATAAAAIDDDLLGEVAVVAADWEAAARQLRERYAGLVDRVSLYRSTSQPADADVPALAAALAG